MYIGRSFGPLAGALAGWSMISAYMFTAVAVALSFAIFLGDFLSAFGVKLNMLPTTAAMLVFIATVTYAAYRDVKLSSRVGLILEVISVGIMIAITAFVIRVQGTVIDPPRRRASRCVRVRRHFRELWVRRGLFRALHRCADGFARRAGEMKARHVVARDVRALR